MSSVNSNTERRGYERYLLESHSATVLYVQAGKTIMKDIRIQDISLSGLGFTFDFDDFSDKQKVYELNLKVDLPSKSFEFSVQIMIIHKVVSNELNATVYGAVYRRLSKSQLQQLKYIVEHRNTLKQLA